MTTTKRLLFVAATLTIRRPSRAAVPVGCACGASVEQVA